MQVCFKLTLVTCYGITESSSTVAVNFDKEVIVFFSPFRFLKLIARTTFRSNTSGYAIRMAKSPAMSDPLQSVPRKAVSWVYFIVRDWF